MALGDAFGHVRDEDVLANLETAPLLDVARDPLGRAGRDGGAQNDRVALAQHGQQVVDHAADLRDVDLDVDVGGGAEREDDVVRLRGVLHEARGAEAPASLDPLKQLLRPGLGERHAPGRDLLEHGGLALDPDHLEAAIRE